MNGSKTAMTVIHEQYPEREDTVKATFNFWGPAWGVIDPPGEVSRAILPNWCNGPGSCWKILTVTGSPTASPRISEGKWSLYRWFRYRGAPVTPRSELVVVPHENIVGGKIGEIIVRVPARPAGKRTTKGKLAARAERRRVKGVVSDAPPDLPVSMGAHVVTLKSSTRTFRVTFRDVTIVADTDQFFAFAALPTYSKKWPTPVYVLDKATGRWKVIDAPFLALWPRVFGPWLATTVEEPNPTGRQSPGVENERFVQGYAWRTSQFLDVRGGYRGYRGSNGRLVRTFMPGKLLLQNLVDGRKITIETGQQDSEVLDVGEDGLVLYRVNNEILFARIEGNKLSSPTLVVKGEDVPEVHWAFWSDAPVKVQPDARPAAQHRHPG